MMVEPKRGTPQNLAQVRRQARPLEPGPVTLRASGSASPTTSASEPGVMSKARVHKRRKAFDTADYAASLKRRQEEWQRRMAGFQGLIMKAARGNREPLIEYFQDNGPFQLSEEDGSWLAWLLETKLPRAAHRPRGSSTPTNKALRTASYLLRHGKRVWCEKHGRQRVSNRAPIVTSLAKRAVELVEQEYRSLRGKLRIEDVIREREAVAFLDEGFLPEAIWEITKVALE